ncbi:MAG: response regulator [Pyrinomonadaceae bacterium]
MKQEIRILILEDTLTDAELIERELRRAELAFTARRVETKDAFLRELTNFAPDIILSDFKLPQFNGLDALRLLKAQDVDAPFILVTGSLTEAVAVECMKEGADDYILKASLKRLPSAMLNALEKRDAKRAQWEMIAALQRSEERFRGAFDNTAIGMAVAAPSGRFLEVNRALCEIVGYTEEELLATDFQSITHPDDLDAKLADRQRLLAGELKTLQLEKRYIGKVGQEIWAVTSVSLVRDAHNTPLYFILQIQDSTERKRAEEALRESEEQLRQSQKLEAFGQLAGGVAHDFNNILTAITGYSDLALRRVASDTALRQHIEEIKKAGERAASLTRQLLAFSRKQILQLKVLDINHVVADVDKMLRRLIGEDIRILNALGVDLWRVKADAGQLEQVILNLAVNARDAMPQGGNLTIETANVEISESHTHGYAGLEPGAYVMLAVSDTGCGMNAETLSRIFEPFFTTKEIGKGTGLGLSTVYGIARQSGGHVLAHSEVGIGSTFKIYLPRVNEPSEPTNTAESRVAVVQPTSQTVLLVEDEESIRQLVREVLEMDGYRVLETSGGDEALPLCRSYEGAIDLMLTDVVMPHMSGRELTERAAFFRPEMKVLYMSGYTDEAIFHHGVSNVGMAYLEKPFAADELVRKVREVLNAPVQLAGGALKVDGKERRGAFGGDLFMREKTDVSVKDNTGDLSGEELVN